MSASVRVNSRTDNVAGVKLPVFNQYETGVENSDNLGLSAGGRKIGACRDRFGEYLKALIKIASLQTSFIAMDEALKITNRRVNALENVTLPKISSTIDYINRYVCRYQSSVYFFGNLTCTFIFRALSELDELEREDFTRLKMVKKKKEEQVKIEAKQKLAREQANAAAAGTIGKGNTPSKSLKISPYISPSQDCPTPTFSPNKGAASATSPLRARDGQASTPSPRAGTASVSARQRGLEDLEEDGDDVVFN